MTDRLVICAAGTIMGYLHHESGRLRLAYEPAWNGPSAFPLSTSLPIAGGAYGHERVYPFIANLLPDNENTIAAWAKEFHCSTHPFSLLRHKGKDCPGAVQFVTDHEVKPLLSGQDDGFEVLTRAEIASRLAETKEAARTGKRTTRSGQFSLAGAQPKLSLARQDGEWGVPQGRVPTTHILKPTVADDGLEINEHFCLRLARALGLPAANTSIETFEEETALLIERYDRDPRTVPTSRIHQEDLCQALCVHPSKKYQNEGGPSASDCAMAIADTSDRPGEDLAHFVEALLFHFVLVATDAHAKNYSLLLHDATSARLAPLYDVASALPYLDLSSRRVKFAMKVGNHYSVRDVDRLDWEKQARSLRISAVRLFEKLTELTNAMNGLVHQVLSQCESEGLTHPVLPRLAEQLVDRCHLLRQTIG